MIDPLAELRREADALLPDCIALRRALHAAPELGLDLPETQRAVLDALAGLDLEIATGGATSAIVATIRGTKPGPTLLLRADMDALPMREATGLPFASTRDAMHACGHDAHVAMLASAMRLLAARRDRLAGTVKAFFQPGEEGFGGAKILIDEGLLAHAPAVDAAFAIHMDSSSPSGSVLWRPGPILAAADALAVELRGRGGHASMPHRALDPIPVACEIVLALQTLVTRRVDAFDPAVLTIARLRAGSTGNVIPSSAQMMGTLRTFSERTREDMHAGIRRVAAGIAAAHGLEADVQIVPGYPVTVNDAGFAGFAQETAAALLGRARVHEMPAPIMGAEDFSYILQQVPGALVFLGARPPQGDPHPLHSDRMTLDEAAFATGIALHAAVALRWLAPEAAR
ncbi:MAG: amidohydrolase [bacterium]|nr:amidohydrolase [bacterium]